MSTRSSLIQVRDAICRIPAVEEFFVQQTVFAVNVDLPIKKQGGEGREEVRQTDVHFRVWIRGNKKHCDETKPSLREAMETAFKFVGIEIPENINL